MSQIKLFLLKIVLTLFSILPFRVMYILSDGLAFILHRMPGYRVKVVAENLRNAFPEKSEAEIRLITRQFYKSLADVLLESMRSPTISPAEATRRCRPVNPEVVNVYLDQNRPVILAGSHLGNWEWGGLSLPPSFHGATITAFKPLSDKTIEDFFNQSRARTGMEMVSMEDLFRVMRKRSSEAAVFILLGDQSPSSRKSAHWVNFLGQPTATLPGTDVLARKFACPVIYYRTVRRSRGFYEIEFEELCADPSIMPDKAITQKYSDTLEKDIRQHPEQWLWSHKRWKMKA
jgi:KDO2-lipid IV(A) lauroyltransferase